MATTSLHNGIFLTENTLRVGSHLDTFHLKSMLGDVQPTDMGVIDLWIDAEKMELPLYQLSSFGKNNIRYVDDPQGRYSWKQPVKQELPYVVEDVEPSNTQKGRDGQSFKLKLNKREFGHGDIITYDKMNGVELYITDEDILPVGDGFIYTVTIRNNDTYKYLDSAFLTPSTKWFRTSSAIGELGQRYADFSVQAGYREYYNFVGNESAHAEYSISSKAELMMRGGVRADGKMDVNTIWAVKDQTLLDPSITNMQQLAGKLGGPNGVATALKEGKLSRAFVTKLEAAGLRKIAMDIETDLMWGKGGTIKTDSGEILRSSIGLWKQLDNSFKKVYNKASFSLDMFESEINNFYYGKVDLIGPDPNRQIIVQTGRAGMRLASQAIAKKAFSQNLTTQSTEIGAIKGKDNMSLVYGMSFIGFTIPFIANVTFIYNPALDPVNANDIENPIIDGFRLSSYSFIIFDITDNGDNNITLVKKQYDDELRWWYENGKFDYQGRTSGFQSSGGNFGYRVKMEKPKHSIWVKDSTRVLKIVMRNPISGSSL